MKTVILGGGESGYGSAVLAKLKNMQVFLSDYGKIDPKYSSILDRYGIEYESGQHSESRIMDADLVIKSPGIPETAPIVRKLHQQGIPVISEIEFAARFTKGRIIAITGSNGKTTTTTLTGMIFKNAGYDSAVCGNIGESFAYTVATDDKEWYVLELSSFQLDGIVDFRPDTAVITNITPDHLDRYDHCYQNYINSKFRIIENQRPEDHFIFGIDSPSVRGELAGKNLNMNLYPFSAKCTPNDAAESKTTDREASKYYCSAGRSVATGAWMLSENVFRAAVEGRSVDIETDRMQIKGIHNIYNAMSAALAALTAGISPACIAETIYAFTGVEHRLEAAGSVNGAEYINDSKATNVDSAWYALDSMTKPTIWIAGGTDKGNDYNDLKEVVANKVKILVCMGVDNAKLIESFKDIVPEIYDTHSLDEAMKVCAAKAAEGDAVLLSPACASFDLFRNYEDRGRQFKAAVRQLASETDIQ